MVGGTPFRDPFGSLKIGAPPPYFGSPVLAVVKEKESVGEGATGLFFVSRKYGRSSRDGGGHFLAALFRSLIRTYQCLMYRTVWAFVPLGLPTA